MIRAPAQVMNGTARPSSVLTVAHAARPPSATVEVDVDGPPVEAVVRRFGAWAAVVLSESLAPGERVSVEVRDGDGRALPFAGRMLSVGAVRDADAAARVAHVIEEASLEAVPRSSVAGRAARFWRTFDRNTHPALLAHPLRRATEPWEPTPAEVAFRVEAGTELATWLAARSCARRALPSPGSMAALRRTVRAAGDALRRADRPLAGERWVPPIAALIRRLVGDRFGDGSAAFRDACGLFAAGRLACRLDCRRSGSCLSRVALSQGGPDGATIVLFAELALAAIELNLDERFWHEALGAFVGMLPVFREAYGTGAGPLDAAAWTRACRAGARRDLDDGRIAALLRVPAGLDALEARLGAEVAETLSGALDGR